MFDNVDINAKDANNIMLKAKVENVYVSNYYGQKTLSKRITFTTSTQEITTEITFRD